MSNSNTEPAISKGQIETAAAKPRIPIALLRNIPEALASLPNWVLWQYERRDRWTKVPKFFREHPAGAYMQNAAADNPATWGDLKTVVGYYWLDLGRERVLLGKERLGMGFVLARSDTDPAKTITCIDLDNCRNRDTGELTPQAAAMVARFNTYTEVSPSGTGLKMYLYGAKPGPRCKSRDHDGIEVFDHKRFVAITGQQLAGTPAAIEHRQAELDALYAELFPVHPQEWCGPVARERAQAATAAPSRNGGCDPTDLCERARRYLDKLPPAISGQGGHDATYHAACVLVRDFSLPHTDALTILAEWNQSHCSPPWSASELLHKLAGAEKAHGPRGRLLEDRPWQPAWLAEIADIPPGSPLEIYWLDESKPLATWGWDGAAATPLPQQTPETPEEQEARRARCRDHNDKQKAEKEAEEKQIEEEYRKRHADDCADQRCNCPLGRSVLIARTKAGTNQPDWPNTYLLAKVLGCNRWDCYWCRQVKVKQWIANVLKRLMESETPTTVYRFHVSDAAWPTVQRYLASHQDANGRRGCYFRMATDGHVYSTVLPAKQWLPAVKELDKQQAAAELEAAIEAIPANWSEGHPITSSRGWKLPVEKSTHEHVVVGMGPRGGSVIADIVAKVEAHGAAAEIKQPRSFFAQYYATVFVKPMGELRLRGLLKDLCGWKSHDERCQDAYDQECGQEDLDDAAPWSFDWGAWDGKVGEDGSFTIPVGSC